MDTEEKGTPGIEEVEEIEDIIKCKHLFSDLSQEDNGLWMCECGVIGTLGANVHKKLVYTLQRVTYNRAEIRREIKRTMKRYKGGKKMTKHI